MSKQVIHVCGYVKSGNTWLARLIGDALNSPVDSRLSNSGNNALADEGFDRPGEFIIKQQHAMLPPKKKPAVVFVYRDPRDMAVSVMHYWSRPNLDETLVIEYKKPPQILHPRGGWSAFMCRWMHVFETDVVTSYERLLTNTAAELEYILMELGVDAVNDLDEVVDRQSFAKKRASIESEDSNIRPYGQTVQLKNMRKGIVGDWKNYFKRRHGEIAQEHWWHWLESLGYEDNIDWWKELPE